MRSNILATTIIAMCSLSSAESGRARLDTERESMIQYHKLIDDSVSVYEFIEDRIPASVLKGAQCIAIIPGVVTGAMIVGATHGVGVASCKKGSCSQPVPVTLNQGSVGFQVGAKSTDLVLFFNSKEASKALKSGNCTFGSEVSAVAGSLDSNVDTSGVGIVAYARAEGVFAGASLNGGTLAKDQDRFHKYYGASSDYTRVLEGDSVKSDEYTMKLTNLLP